VIIIASVKKFTENDVSAILAHNERSIHTPSNLDIQPELSSLNYHLEPVRPLSCYDYFKKRKSELYSFQRKDVKVMAGWIITAPRELPAEQQKAFFRTAYQFLADRYGSENIVQAVVHCDEAGQPHLHCCFIPVVPDSKHAQGFKICASEVLNRQELRNFHPALQKALLDAGIQAKVQTGITRKNGRNYSVAELKQKELQYNHKEVQSWTW
jgi:hypothetical protein